MTSTTAKCVPVLLATTCGSAHRISHNLVAHFVGFLSRRPWASTSYIPKETLDAFPSYSCQVNGRELRTCRTSVDPLQQRNTPDPCRTLDRMRPQICFPRQTESVPNSFKATFDGSTLP